MPAIITAAVPAAAYMLTSSGNKGVPVYVYVIFGAIILAIIAAAVLLAVYMFSYGAEWLLNPFRFLANFIWRSKLKPTGLVEKAAEEYGFTYDPEQDIFYSLMYPWQRKYGYCRLYDESTAPLGIVVDCEPFCFDYGGKKWLIEFWKGQYGMTTGCEVGMFYRDSGPDYFSGALYKSVKDADMLDMSFTLERDGEKDFSCEGKHWWLTGFRLGEFSEPCDLTMYVSIAFKNTRMRDAFLEALCKTGYSQRDVMIEGDTVSVRYREPHTKQPETRTKAIEWIVQERNKLFCTEYKSLTEEYGTMTEKLKAIKEIKPEMYYRMLNMGKTKQIFSSGAKK